MRSDPPEQLARRTKTDAAIATIRVFTEDDVPAAAALFARVYPEYRWRSQDACESYFREILFENPWRDPDIPSWVAEENGRLSGFYAVLPRRMQLHGRPIRVAVGCQFMMAPDNRNSLAALQLTKACISGPQDLTLADGANAQARRMWVAIGGVAPLLYGLHWTRLLRPARHAFSLLQGRGRNSACCRASRPSAVRGRGRAVRPSAAKPFSARPTGFLRERAGPGGDAVAFFRLHGRQRAAPGIQCRRARLVAGSGGTQEAPW